MQPKILSREDLKDDQNAVVDTILEFAKDPSMFELRVEGPAGSGKTSSIRVAVMERAGRGTVICAPTNKAVKVARELSDGVADTMTIYKLLGLSLQANGEVKELRQSDEALDRLANTKLVMLDEASMAGTSLYPYIQDAIANYGIKFVYICDRYQAPPVGEEQSWVFTKVRSNIRLTEVKRHDNAILNLATHLRGVMDNGGKGLNIVDDFCPEQGGVEVFTRAKAFDAAIVDRWAETQASADRDFSGHRILAWRNARVQGFNELVRETIYGRREARENGLMQGERIVVCNPVMSLQDSSHTLMHTDEEGFIEKISIAPHPNYPEIECYKMVVLRESTGDVCGLFTPTEAGWRVANRMLRQFQQKATRDDRVFWGAFWTLKEQMNDVRPCHALTVHRSQGSTFREVFVDADDIMANRTQHEALQLLYVAVTRASFKVNVKWSGR